MEKTNKPQKPYLLRIPLNQEGSNAQPSTFKSPKLLKVVLPGYRDKIGKPKELFRLPLSELPLNYSNQNQRNASKGLTDRHGIFGFSSRVPRGFKDFHCQEKLN